MSEIKGQLLGIVLAIAMFGIIFGLLQTSFGRTTQKVSDRMEDTAENDGYYEEVSDTDLYGA